MASTTTAARLIILRCKMHGKKGGSSQCAAASSEWVSGGRLNRGSRRTGHSSSAGSPKFQPRPRKRSRRRPQDHSVWYLFTNQHGEEAVRRGVHNRGGPDAPGATWWPVCGARSWFGCVRVSWPWERHVRIGGPLSVACSVAREFCVVWPLPGTPVGFPIFEVCGNLSMSACTA